MTEKTDKDKTEKAPVTAAETDALWNEFAAHFEDPNSSKIAGGAKVDDDEPPKTPEQKPSTDGDATDAKATETKAAPAAEDDLWKGAEIDPKTNQPRDPETAALKAAYDAAPESARPAIEATQRRSINRGKEIARLRTAVHSTRTAAPASKDADKPAKAAEPPKDITTDANWKKAKDEYAEVLGPVEDQLKTLQEQNAKLLDRLNKVESRTIEHDTVVRGVAADKQGDLVVKARSDYNDTLNSEGFREAFDGWIVSQPKVIRDMVERNAKSVVDAQEAVTVYDLFVAQTGFRAEQKQAAAKAEAKSETSPATSAKRKAQLEASAEVPNRGGGSKIAADPNDTDYWWALHAKRFEAEGQLQH